MMLEVDYRVLERFVKKAFEKLGRNGEQSGEVLRILGKAVEIRVSDLIEKMVEVANHRLDNYRTRYMVKIENDPCKQQWLYNEYENNKYEEEQEKMTVKGKEIDLSQSRNKVTNQALRKVLSIETKSWMSESIKMNTEDKMLKNMQKIPSITAITEREFLESIQNKEISFKDTVFVLENDTFYSKNGTVRCKLYVAEQTTFSSSKEKLAKL